MKCTFFKFFITICFMLLISGLVVAQKAANDLNAFMQKVRRSKYEPVPDNLLKSEKKEKEFVIALVPYLHDTIESVREKAYFILKQVGLKSKDQDVRQDVVIQLSKGIRDRNSGISGKNTEALCGFSRSDFTDVSKDSIVNVTAATTPHLDQVVKLTGYLGLKKSLEKLRVFSTSPTASLRWASVLAMARMGDRGAVDYILKKLNTASVNDDFVYDIVPDLVYTRQKELFSFLDEIIRSDKPSCESANPDSNEKILCAYRVMEYMAPVIAGFPLKTDAAGTLIERDYKKSLETLRTWLNQNQHYQLIDNSF